MPHETAPERWGGMRNEAIQAFILKQLEGYGVVIDAYDGAIFAEGSLADLREKIRFAYNEISLLPPNLAFKEAEMAFFNSYLHEDLSAGVISPRAFALEELRLLASLIAQAVEEGEHVIFLGD